MHRPPSRRHEVRPARGTQTDIHLLICDVQLPDGDGRDLLGKLSGEREIVGLAVSGHCGPDDLARTKAAGFFAHLVKPFLASELESLLASAQRELKRRRGVGPAKGGRK